MFSPDGFISLPDAIWKIRIASMKRVEAENGAATNGSDPISTRDAYDVLWDFVGRRQRAWLIDAQGGAVRVSQQFLANALTVEGQMRYVDALGVVSKRGVMPGIEVWKKANWFIWLSILCSTCGAAVCFFALYALDLVMGRAESFALILGPIAIGVLLSCSDIALSHLRQKYRFGIPKAAVGRTLAFDRAEFLMFLCFKFPANTATQENESAIQASESATAENPDPFCETASNGDSTVGAERDGTRYIVKAWNDGERFTKADMKAILTAPEHPRRLSVRGFGRAWDSAREQIPEIGKPGRKSDF